MNIKCEVIRDLLPLYVDGVVSEESRALIEEHLRECPDCSECLKLLQEDYPLSEETEFADEAEALKRIKRRIRRSRILAVLITIGFAIAALAVIGAMKLTEYEGTLEENVSYELPAGYEEVAMDSVAMDRADPENCKQYVRESSKYKETILVYYDGFQDPYFISSKDIIHVDSSTDVEINTYDWSNNSENELNCIVQHDKENYTVEYRCKVLAKDNYYSSCSQSQQDDILAFIKTFDYHRPVDSGGNIFSKLYHNLGTGGCMLLALTLLVFIGVPIAIGIASIFGSKNDDSNIDAVISSRDLHESMNRERAAKGEATLPAINNVQGASSNNLARRDHSWSSVPDFFLKLFRRN